MSDAIGIGSQWQMITDTKMTYRIEAVASHPVHGNWVIVMQMVGGGVTRWLSWEEFFIHMRPVQGTRPLRPEEGG
jgi:hypothetical protein